jgi:hypothetical protein
MILKRGEPADGLGLGRFVRKDRMVLAKRMRESFMIETDRGWSNGNNGDWLVYVGGDLWLAVADEQFQRIYRPYDHQRDCIGPCDDFGPEKSDPL